jgi:hypothetical protein
VKGHFNPLTFFSKKETSMTLSSTSSNWSTWSLLVFRFGFFYFILYIIPFPFTALPFLWRLWQEVADFSFTLIDSLYKDFMGIAYTPLVRPGGSGDTTYNYLQLLMFFSTSCIGALIWTILDRKRSNYNYLAGCLLLLLQLFLGCTMLIYGFAKVFHTQFGVLTLQRLSQTYGQSSPMGLLWTFMGYSSAYNVFTGMAEVLGGFLVILNRTRVLGALITIAVMSNVVMLNFTYDVPVKIFSSHLLIMAFVILIPDVKRLVGFFITNRSVPASHTPPLLTSQRGKKILLWSEIVFVVYTCIVTITANVRVSQQRPVAMKSNIPTYDVKSHIINTDTLNNPGNETRCWKTIAFNTEGKAGIKYADGASLDWNFKADSAARQVTLKSPDGATTYKLNYAMVDDQIVWKGTYNNDSVTFLLTKGEGQDYPLLSRGFHWIDEYPFNR